VKKLLIALGVVVLIGGLGAAGAWFFIDRRLSEFSSQPWGTPETKLVEIPVGSNPKVVAALLAKAQVVSDDELLYRYLRRERLGPRLKAGEYEFSGALRPSEVVDKLVRGEVKQYHFTVPEGLRVDEILPILAASELKLARDKLESLTRTPAFARKLGIPADSFEGFLAPDTYSFNRGASEEAVLRRMVERTFEELKRAPRKAGVELDTLATLTLASIVEKETGAGEERPRISCVFHNRLRLGMKLMTDPTVLYAKMLRTGAFSKNITRADLLAEHPYNTYTTKGLPPGPIAAPGAAAIEAALNPPSCDDLYFVSKNDGTSAFCPDLKCHNAAVQKWQVEYHRKKKAPRNTPGDGGLTPAPDDGP
jgi:UPF0755 protein